jgi:hypothetical protein
MRTNAVVASLAKVAIHTKHLKSWRVPFAPQKSEQMMASPPPVFSSRTQFSPVCSAIKVDVVKRQKLRVGFTATSTLTAAIGLKGLNLELQMLIL